MLSRLVATKRNVSNPYIEREEISFQSIALHTHGICLICHTEVAVGDEDYWPSVILVKTHSICFTGEQKRNVLELGKNNLNWKSFPIN